MTRFIATVMAAAALLAASASWALSPFVLFFDSGSTRLHAPAHAILDNAAASFRTIDVRQVDVVASTDRVGSAAANLRLSQRRAEVVRDALVARGYSGQIRIVAAGETQLLVDTPDEVAEPQNRNVAIIITRACLDHFPPGGGPPRRLC